MAIENVQYIYDYIRLYKKTIRPIIIQFLYVYKKNNKINSIKQREHAVEADRHYFVPQKCSNEPSSNAKNVV